MRPITSPWCFGGFRLGPPELNVDLIIRPRLMSVLQRRFEHRLTLVTAGPGFGKTCVLAQARTENLLTPRGVDAWLTCNAGDNTVSILGAGIAQALQIDEPAAWNSDHLLDHLTAELWRRSPEHIALILDDAHLIIPRSPGAGLLTTLLERMPRNCHLVLAGRRPLPLGGTRLAAMGQAVELGEEDLAFSADELAEFASVRGLPLEALGETGGWPALAELTASIGWHRVRDYLWEELLTRMPPDRRRLLTRLALVGGGDDELASALAGRPVDLADLLAGLPLVAGVPGTWRSLHPLWWPALSHELSLEEQTETRERAAAVLRSRGDVDGAVRQLAQAGAWDKVHDVICETASTTHPLVAPDVLTEWHDLLPEEHREAAVGRLLGALVERGTDQASARTVFEQVEAEFHAAGSLVGEIAALTHVGHLSWWLDDADRLQSALARAQALAERIPEFGPRLNVGRAWLADLRGDWKAGITGLSPENCEAGSNILRSWLLLHDGDPVLALEYADLAVKAASGTFSPAAVNLRLLATWLSGDPDAAMGSIRVLASVSKDAARALGYVFELSTCALLLAFSGEVEAARRHLDEARVTLPSGNSGLIETSFRLAEAAVLVAEDDEEAAAGLLADVVRQRPSNLAYARLHRLFLALSYVLVPESRAQWDATDLPPVLARTRDIAATLVASREARRPTVPRARGASSGQVRAALPLPWAVEYAVALCSAGQDDGRDLLHELGPAARPYLQALARSSRNALATAARDLAQRAPVVPSERLELRVLGPLELWRNGRPVDHPSLQRDRVRQLLLFMVAQKTVSRMSAAAMLWPDLDADAATRNLRVTLNYTQRLLEPERANGEAPYFLRTEQGMLRLTTEEPLFVDAWQFEALLDQAEISERQGVPSMALRTYRRALPLYRGDYLADVPHAEWAMVERDRLRMRYVLGAVRAGELLLATGERDAALDLAHAALRADRWSESAYRLLVAGHLERNEYDAARHALTRCEGVLAELGTRPDRETQIIARRVRRA